MQKFGFILLAMLFLSLPLRGQQLVTGYVYDIETGEPLAFVNIVYNDRGTGTTTGLDGHFTIKSDVLFLKLSYVGYEPVTVYPADRDFLQPLRLAMKRKPYLIEEVKIFPGVNPAHRIIDEVFRNRNENNPERLSSFSYTSYNKLYFTLMPDTLLTRIALPEHARIRVNIGGVAAGMQENENNIPDNDTLEVQQSETEVDSSELKIKEFTERQHLFIMESVSQRDYLRPGRNNERVIASRVNGFRDPSFFLLATQLQSFSFYEDFIFLLEGKYLNPISRGSTTRYSFILEDSLFTEQNDTLFIISFRPYPDRNFEGLQGVLYINSNGYAIQNAVAWPFEPRGFFTARIQQNYRLVDGSWFPVELNSHIILRNESPGPGNRYNLVGTGNSYLSDIHIEPALRKRDFNHIELTISPDAHRRDEEFWDRYRNEPLSGKDRETYRVIDSIGQEVNLDRSLRIFETLATGYIPWGIFNIDYSSLLDYNYFERFRPGIRIISGNRLSERFTAGGHIAWGSGDRKIRYGGEASILLYRPGNFNLGFFYKNDVEEPGTYSFAGAHSAFPSEDYRRFFVGRMDYVQEYNGSLNFRFLRHFAGRLYFSRQEVRPPYPYVFLNEGREQDIFYFTETGIKLRFAWREKFMQTPRGNRISMGSDFPLIWFNYGRGLDIQGGEYVYTRLQAGIHHSIHTKRLGRTYLTVEGGTIDRDVPLSKLYNGKGSYRSFAVEAANSFATMRMTEFLSSEFVSVFFRQNFESLLFKTGRFRPEILFITNIGFGRLENSAGHLNLHLRAPEKGYFESGLLINNIFTRLFAGYGLGVFYRYGPYRFDDTLDNFAFKMTFSMNLRNLTDR